MGRFALVCALLVSLGCFCGSASGEDAGMPSMSAPASLVGEPDIEWLWGEVVSVDAAAKAVKIKFLDYETDEEKETSMAVDSTTTYENVSGLEQLKAGDTVSVDYVYQTSGMTLAKNVSVEQTQGAATDQGMLMSSPEIEAADAAAAVEAPLEPAAEPMVDDIAPAVSESAADSVPVDDAPADPIEQ